MEPFKKITGVVAALNRVNVDTDQIIPAEHLKRIEKTGFGPFLFESWGKNADGTPNPDFELNRPSFAGASDTWLQTGIPPPHPGRISDGNT